MYRFNRYEMIFFKSFTEMVNGDHRNSVEAMSSKDVFDEILSFLNDVNDG